mmetsp:Transcript_51513/g.161545  ORF Transcript_51513/g.161545 Transcript_51513/m.161545 type:complete len:269 (+) Transcript_51513:204-1010(+)
MSAPSGPKAAGASRYPCPTRSTTSSSSGARISRTSPCCRGRRSDPLHSAWAPTPSWTATAVPSTATEGSPTITLPASRKVASPRRTWATSRAIMCRRRRRWQPPRSGRAWAAPPRRGMAVSLRRRPPLCIPQRRGQASRRPSLLASPTRGRPSGRRWLRPSLVAPAQPSAAAGLMRPPSRLPLPGRLVMRTLAFPKPCAAPLTRTPASPRLRAGRRTRRRRWRPGLPSPRTGLPSQRSRRQGVAARGAARGSRCMRSCASTSARRRRL